MSTNKKSLQLPAGFWSFFWAFLGFAWVSTSIAYAANLDSTASNGGFLPDGNRAPVRSEVFVSRLISTANGSNRCCCGTFIQPASEVECSTKMPGPIQWRWEWAAAGDPAPVENETLKMNTSSFRRPILIFRTII